MHSSIKTADYYFRQHQLSDTTANQNISKMLLQRAMQRLVRPLPQSLHPKNNPKAALSTKSNYFEKKHDSLQEKALKENCILVDENDKALGAATKASCHRVDQKTGSVKLHRAFSVFLFNTSGEMLVQRRSKQKITFPDTYTNACCSHPLFDIEEERIELNALGIRKAAQRRLNYELGIPTSQIQPEHFHYLTRIHYGNRGNGIWGEHEIDYILFLQKDVDIIPNSNEVSEVRYIKRIELDDVISNLDAPLTPWFELILQHRLRQWWDNLHQLNKWEDLETINRFQTLEKIEQQSISH